MGLFYGLVIGFALFVFVAKATAHHPAPKVPKKTEALVIQYEKLYDAAKEGNGGAGRNVALFGRPKDGKLSWNLVRSEYKRLWVLLHPGPEREHKRRARKARLRSLGTYGQAQLAAARRGIVGYQWQAMASLIRRESGFNPRAVNPSSGACGLPQALPCSKIPGGVSASVDTQIGWMVSYIRGRYGTPAAALSHSHSRGWY